MVELTELQRAEETAGRATAQGRRNRVQVVLDRLKAGSCGAISAIQSRDGRLMRSLPRCVLFGRTSLNTVAVILTLLPPGLLKKRPSLTRK